MAQSVTVAEASSMLGVSPKRVRQLIAEGRLSAIEESPVKLSASEVTSLAKQRLTNASVTRAKTIKRDSTSAILEQVSKEREETLAIIASERERTLAFIQSLIETVQTTQQRELEYRETDKANLIDEINRLKAENAELKLSRKKRFFNRSNSQG